MKPGKTTRLIEIFLGLLFIFIVLLVWQNSWAKPILKFSLPPVISPRPFPSPAPELSMSTIIVPFGDTYNADRDKYLAEIAQTNRPKTIILAYPYSGEKDFYTVIAPSENVVIDTQVLAHISQLSTVARGTVDEEVNKVMQSVRTQFPESTIVPLGIKPNTSLAVLRTMNESLVEVCADCLILAMSEYSTHVPTLLSSFHDNLTLRALQDLDVQTLAMKSEVSAPAIPALAILWAQRQQTEKFVLHNHIYSGEETGNPDSNTSYMFGAFEKGAKTPPPSNVSFVIGGDMMFGRSVAHTYMPTLEKVWANFGERVFWGTDAGIANLEGPISGNPVPDDIRPNNLIFNFPPETIKALQSAKINVVSLANNHSLNQGKKGLETTQTLLDAANIQWFGGPNDDGVTKTTVISGKDLKLHVIGVHTLASIPDLTEQIKAIKSDPKNRVLVFPHWGAEYQPKHGQSQATQAKAWIDAGADIVIGAHPHVIQDAEIYKGKPIFYSLGNLIFDQYFSKETQQGLLLAGEFTSSSLRLFALPVEAAKSQPALLRGDKKKAILDTLYNPLSSVKQSTPLGEVLVFPSS